MASRIPGLLCVTQVGHYWIDQGTVCRSRSGLPGVEGYAQLHIGSHDLYFLVLDQNSGRPMGHTPYRLSLETGQCITGLTDHRGRTQKLCGNSPLMATLEIPYHGDRTSSLDPRSGSVTCHR